LQVGFFFWQNRPLHRADLQANAAVNTGGKVNPVPVCSFGVFPRALMNAGYWTGIDTIGDSFANVGDNSVRHDISLKK
jgi:hypothetical protein